MWYKIQSGMWAWLFHRITGVGVVLFLLLHIVDIALIGWGPETFNKILFLYRHPLFRISEAFLFGAVLYHALNGIRIIIIDFWRGATKYQRQMVYAEVVFFVLLFIPVAYIMISPLFFE